MFAFKNEFHNSTLIWLYSPSQPVAPSSLVTLFFIIMTLLLLIFSRPLLRRINCEKNRNNNIHKAATTAAAAVDLAATLFVIDFKFNVSTISLNVQSTSHHFLARCALCERCDYSTLNLESVKTHKTLVVASLNCAPLITVIINAVLRTVFLSINSI